MKKPRETAMRWVWRALLAAFLLSAAGYYMTPASPPLMCKVYG